MEIRINKEVRNYQESLFFGLSLRQLLFALLAVAVAVGVYFGLRPVLGNGEIGWVCVLAAFPFALGGFFQYNSMTFEQFILAVIRSELLYPKRHDAGTLSARVYPLGIPVSPQARVQIGQHIRQGSGKFNDKGGSQT